MAVFEILVHDIEEDYDELPASLITLKEWWKLHSQGQDPFELHPYECIGISLSDSTHHLIEENFGGLTPTATGCHALTERLKENLVALLRISTENSGAYLLF